MDMESREIVPLSRPELELMLDAAAERGARKALAAVGLEDEGAGGDIRDLRGLLGAIRQMKSEALRTLTRTLTVALLGAVFIGIAVKLKVFGN